MLLVEDNYHLQLSDKPLDLKVVENYLNHREGGGRVIFSGHVREEMPTRQVLYLEFEAYEPMALKEMATIARTALQRWPILKIVMLHRLGRVEVGEMPVIIGVATAHRQVAFTAAQYLIDTLKETVPIWKKEHYHDGSVWVSAHP